MDAARAEYDANGVPIIRSVSSKLAALERRRDRLERNLDERRGSPGSLSFDRSEFEAVEAALVALKYHRAAVERMGHPLEALRALVDAYEGPVDQEGRMRLAVAEARKVLELFAG